MAGLPTREIVLRSHPGTCGGALLLTSRNTSIAPRLTDVLDRVRAGDSVESVADDFGVSAGDVLLLAQAARALAGGDD